MNNQDNIIELRKIAGQLPNPYTKGVFYDVTMPDGKKAQARSTKPGFLHIRKMVKHILKSPNGEVLRESMEYAYFRCNMRTGEIIEL